MILKNLNIGMPSTLTNKHNQTYLSGIGKKSVPSAYLTKLGFENDGVADLKHHGGEDRAVCFYPFEHYSWWKSLYEEQLNFPAFGENATVINMLESEVCIGDVYKMGEAIVQISQGRIPCSTIDRFNQVKGMLSEVIKTGRTGYLAKVLEEGIVESGAKLELQARPHPNWTIAEIHRLFFHDRNNHQRIAQAVLIPELAEAMRKNLQKLLPKDSN